MISPFLRFLLIKAWPILPKAWTIICYMWSYLLKPSTMFLNWVQKYSFRSSTCLDMGHYGIIHGARNYSFKSLLFCIPFFLMHEIMLTRRLILGDFQVTCSGPTVWKSMKKVMWVLLYWFIVQQQISVPWLENQSNQGDLEYDSKTYWFKSFVPERIN